MLTRNGLKNKKNNLISATKISNYIKKDTILDYLDLLNNKNLTLNQNLNVTKKRSNNDDHENIKKRKTSFDYIMESGYNFENDIIKNIEYNMKENNEFNKLIKIEETNIMLNCNLTIKIIKENKHSIILGSILINKKNNTWGKPDLLVKGEWINKYIENEIESIEKDKWYIIDIKSSTINLINKGEDISLKLLYSVYKSQIYIYTEAINELMKEHNIDNNVQYGFILGKKYKYILNKNIILKKPFECLAVIDFKKEFTNGVDWKKNISEALDWLKDLNTNWENYTLNPINKDELYPNMKNSYDKNWHNIKKKIAYVNKEITLLWNCGINNRNLAWNNNIKRYDDPNLNTNILGFLNSSKETIIDLMLKTIHSNNNYVLDKNNNLYDWQNMSDWEFYVDFETYNTDAIYDENNDFDNIFTSNQIIYMIGVCYIKNNKLIHKSFIINYEKSNLLNKEFEKKKFDDVKYKDCVFCKNELELIKKFNNFILEFKPENIDKDFYNKNMKLYHWSGAEPIIFNKKIKEYSLYDINLNWTDLLKIFKCDRYPIIIKECFGFGLKEIVKKLNEYNEINLAWSDLDDGLLSSFIARDIYYNQNNNSNDDMFNIIEYNYIDCKALFKILEWMRKVIR